MSVRAMTRVWEKSQSAGTELLMLLAIADFANDDGYAYPSVGTLAKKCRMTTRNVNLILASLRGSGELSVRQNKGPKGVNLYLINHPPPEADFTPEESFTLKRVSFTPGASFPKPLKATSDKPSVNHQEPSERKQRSPKGARLPSDWVVPFEYIEFAIKERGWNDIQARVVADKFKDYWVATCGRHAIKRDWMATWRNWVRAEKGVPANNSRGAGKSSLDAINHAEGIGQNGTF